MLKMLKHIWRKIRAHLAFIAIALAAGGLSSLLTHDSMAAFELLRKPPLSPPGWLFPIVWSVLYVLMGISMGMVYKRSGGETRREAVFLWSAQLAVNFFWSIIYFVFQYRLFAFLWLLLLLALVLWMTFAFSRVSKGAAYLQLPYILWLIFAGYLNFGVYLLNR